MWLSSVALRYQASTATHKSPPSTSIMQYLLTHSISRDILTRSVPDIPADDAGPQCVEPQAAICAHRAFVPGRSRKSICGSDSIHSGEAS